MKHKCKCGHVGKGIVKMGGLICEKCRTILYYPGTPQYQKAKDKK